MLTSLRRDSAFSFSHRVLKRTQCLCTNTDQNGLTPGMLNVSFIGHPRIIRVLRRGENFRRINRTDPDDL